MREAADFGLAMRGGRRAGTSELVLHLAPGPAPEAGATDPNPPATSTLVGFAVSRKVGSAVVRNRVKRQLRHLMRERIERVPPGSRIVVRALPPSAGASSAELARALDVTLERSSRIRAKR